MTEFPGWGAQANDVRHWLCQTLQNLADNGYDECQEFLRIRADSVDQNASGSSSLLPVGQKSVDLYPTCKPQSLLEVAMLVLFSVSLAICFLVVYFVFRWYRCNVIQRPASTWALSSSRLPPIVYSSTLRAEIRHPIGADSISGTSDGFTVVNCGDLTAIPGAGETGVFPLLHRPDLPPSYGQVMRTSPDFSALHKSD
ncbi:hypothetical protein BV898_02431 [Hypsibius exemplaris]|uniref:Uncharacterized protein n=1 Tax=Hypsibius exemplaris TaxID=2072580 RepID=A0A1W0X8G0_HYPEX|nr:hypothetical protein BV898_02431 [Hypsibius exemplaris]